MGDIKISIILPNYNSEKYLAKCIQSFVEQNYENKELIIVDGKSNDNSHNIIKEYSDIYENIHWVKEQDICVTDGFNIGLKYTSGDFIGFMASDSIYYETDIFSSINNSYKIINFDCVHFNAYSFFVDGDQRNISLRNCNYPFTRDSFLLNKCFIPFENIFFHKKIYEEEKLDPSFNLSSDIEFYLRVLQKNILSFFIDKPSTINIYDGGNLSSVFSNRQVAEWQKVDIKFLFVSMTLTEEKFNFHKAMLDDTLVVNKESIQKTEKWLLELLEANRQTQVYSENAFVEKFIMNWYYTIRKGTYLGLWSYFKFTKSSLFKTLQLPKPILLKLFVKCLVRR